MNPGRMQILYVDDDRINTLLFVEACRPDSRLHVRTASSGLDALGAARDCPPDVLVIDLHMPEMDGLELLLELRKLPELAQAPAFLCTAELVDEVGARAFAAGFDGIWSKPVELRRIVSDVARAQALRSDAAASAP